MFCPQCGQQQVSNVTRYCSKCGFLLDGVAVVLASGGALPTTQVQASYRQLSPRSKGIRQGALLMLSTLLLVPLVTIISVFFVGSPELFVSVTAITLFVGGLLRIFYALLMEESVSPVTMGPLSGHLPTAVRQFDQPPRNAALPPAAANSAAGWRARPNTAELYQPPSITAHTTRLLDKDEPKNR
ncbi:MAG TPA: zinc ribbon domain-containing protein [Pyrinomonadaceae bacterium]|nr:zinc ribbon domain-containing protein [Pyrinomonadaceae bacterium]